MRFLIVLLTFPLFIVGCTAMPLATVRDASILPQGGTAGGMAIASPVLYGDWEFSPTAFGGTTFEYTRRKGLANGRERAFRFGVTSGLLGSVGIYAGVEGAKDMRKGTRKWGTVGYLGATGGIDGLWGTYLPAHPYGQLYSGLVIGKVADRFRPELNLRATLQGGSRVGDWYGAGMATVEPRLRWMMRGGGVFFGLGLQGGYLLCNDCVFREETVGKAIFGVQPALGVALP